MERDGTSHHYPMIYVSLLTTQNIPLRIGIKDFTEAQGSRVFYVYDFFTIYKCYKFYVQLFPHYFYKCLILHLLFIKKLILSISLY